MGDEVRMAEIQVAAWRRAYSGIMSPALLDALDINQKTAMWRNALERAGKGFYRVAEVNGRVEGFAVFGPARDKDLRSSRVATITRLNTSRPRLSVPNQWLKLGGCNAWAALVVSGS